MNTFHAFCSLLLPGLGQLLQRRPGAAIGFFVLFLVSGFLPVLIVSLLFMDRFSYQPLYVHLLHIFTFGGLYLVFLLAIFWAVLDAAGLKFAKKTVAETEKSETRPPRRSHFPVVELLVVIAIIGMLVALLLPSVPTAREAARRMQCANNMKQILIGLQNYHDTYNAFPPAYTVDEDGKPLHSWRVLILPFIEQQALYEQIRLDEPWDSEHNRQFHAVNMQEFRCPSAVDPRRESVPVPAPTGCYYSLVTGPETAFDGPKSKSESAGTNLSNTIFLVERRTPVNWMNPLGEMTFETACQGINVDAMGISSYHPGGANVGMADGAVRFLSDTIDKDELREMLMFKKTKQK